MKRLMPMIVAFACLAPGCAPAERTPAVRIEAAGLKYSDVREERRASGRAMRVLLLHSQFDRLDQIADSLRVNRSRSADGTWKLRRFYGESFDDGAETPWSEAEWTQLLHQLRVWREVRRKSITAPVALACGLVGYAWHARGAGYANTVSRNGRQLMAERLEEARLVLADARRLPEVCPGWYSAGQLVALGQGWPRAEYDRLFDEAIERTPDFDAYYALKSHYLLPKWYGKPGEWEVFATECSSRLPDSLGARVYAQIVWSRVEDYGNIVQEASVSWPRTKQGFQLLVADDPASLQILSEFAFLACCAADRDEARRLFDKIGARVELGVWRDDQRFLHARMWARAPVS